MQTSLNLTNNTQKEKKYRYKKKLRSDEVGNLWLGRIFIWIMIAITLFPIIAVYQLQWQGNSFTQTTFFPAEWTLENYKRLIDETNFLTWVNSLLICTTVAFIQLALSIPAAFAFSKLRFWENGLMSLLILQMFPTTMALPAIIGIVYTFNLSNRPWVLILILAGGSAYNIWLLKGTIDGIPNELVEAAYIDGASVWQTL